MRASATVRHRLRRGCGILDREQEQGGPPPRERVLRRAARVAAAGLVALALLADRLTGATPDFGLLQAAALAAGLLLALVSWLPRRPAAALILLCASGIAGLAIAEIALRLAWSGRTATIYRLDPLCLHRYIPGSAKVFKHTAAHGGRSIAVRINRLGYRGEELAEPGSGTRIVVFGDSFVAAEFSSSENTFVQRLAAELGEGVEAVNAGVVAYGPDQVLARLEQDLRLLRPDLVVVAVYAGNDFGDLLRNKLFRLDESGELEAAPFVPGADLEQRFSRARSGSALYRLLLRSLHAAPEPASMEAWLRHRRAEFEDFVVHGNLVVDNILADTYDADVSLEPDSESARYKARLMDRVVGGIKAVADRAGTPLLLVLIPSPMELHDHPGLPRVDAREFPGYEPGGSTDLLARIAARHGIPAVNLFGPLRDGDPATLFFAGDDHWNDAGQALAARVVAGRVRAGRMLERR